MILDEFIMKVIYEPGKLYKVYNKNTNQYGTMICDNKSIFIEYDNNSCYGALYRTANRKYTTLNSIEVIHEDNN